MEIEVLGNAASGPSLSLDHREFAYAGKFVMTNTGKAVAKEQGEVIGAVSFSPDRAHANRAWLRYVTVRDDRQGERIGPKLAIVATVYLHDEGFDQVQIGVNNPFAYHALYHAGFGWMGEETGVAELVLVHPTDRGIDEYQAGLDRFQERDELSEAERSFIADHRNTAPPPVVDPPD